MSDANETIADIIAKKRREANYIVQVAQGRCHTRRDKAEDEARDIRREADRIEAAYKRERGNCAKLREALELCVKGMCGFCRMDAEARGMTTECVNGCEALLKAKAALSAPPRNCDLYKTKEKAQEVFMKEPCDHPCGDCCVVDINNECGVDWLFAPATEKKGLVDENK